MQMNADLKNALLEVQAYFLEAKIYQNVVEFTLPELSTNDMINLLHVHRKNNRLFPWVFRSDKEVRIVFFVKDENGVYLTSPSERKQIDDEGELQPMLPDNVNSREEWIEYILTIHQIKVSEIIPLIQIVDKSDISEQDGMFKVDVSFASWLTDNCSLDDGIWTLNDGGEDYSLEGIYKVYLGAKLKEKPYSR